MRPRAALVFVMTAISLIGCRAPVGPVVNHADSLGLGLPVQTLNPSPHE